MGFFKTQYRNRILVAHYSDLLGVVLGPLSKILAFRDQKHFTCKYFLLGDLALLLLVQYKDHPDKLTKIMEKLLDKEIHKNFKAPIDRSYYAQQPHR